ncbi:hypothetical protein LRQ11_24720, partial [Pseudomonas sp. MAFF 311095]|uniref:hypothetical protein n=1 Tax=Pseudomonas petroselini TaxID=2899822 RepID=UPI0020B32359
MLKNRLQDPSLLAELAYVDGQWIAADSAATLDIRDPATGHVPGPRSRPMDGGGPPAAPSSRRACLARL